MEKIVTIPKELAKQGDLVVIPRKEYEGLVRRQKIVPVVKMNAAQKRDLEEARRGVRAKRICNSRAIRG